MVKTFILHKALCSSLDKGAGLEARSSGYGSGGGGHGGGYGYQPQVIKLNSINFLIAIPSLLPMSIIKKGGFVTYANFWPPGPQYEF